MKIPGMLSLILVVLVSCSSRILDDVKYTSRPPRTASVAIIKALSDVNSPADDFALTSTRLGKEIFFNSLLQGTY